MVGGRQALQSINGGGGRFIFVDWRGGDGEVTAAQRKDAQVVQVGMVVAGGLGADVKSARRATLAGKERRRKKEKKGGGKKKKEKGKENGEK